MLDLDRLIPACAGKTLKIASTAPVDWAHPRVCGENAQIIGGAVTALGSSPRVRGKLLNLETVTDESGLIPACAGKTLRPNP